MASRQFFRNLLSLDTNLVALEVAIAFGANGAPILQQWVPPTASAPGHYVNAPIGGCEGIAAVQKRATGDCVVILQDGYQRVKGVLPTWRNSLHLGIAAPIVEVGFGQLDSTSAYPDMTSVLAQRLAAGHSGTAVSAAQPTFTVNSATFPSTMVGLLFTDSAGVSATILAAASDTITLSGVATPATGAGWSITSGGTVILNAAILTGARSSTAFTAATFTDGAATWLVNQFKGQNLVDSTGTTFAIQSNTATVLTLRSISQSANPTTGCYVITNSYKAGTQYTVTGTTLVAGAPTIAGTANTATPTAHVNWFAGQFAGMFLVDSAGVQWLITTNSTTALTVASNGSNTTPADGAFSIVTVAGGATIEFTTAASSSAAPTVGTLTAAAGVSSTPAANLNGALTAGSLPFVSAAAGTTSTVGVTGTLVAGALSQTLTAPASGEFLLLTLILSDSTIQS